MQRRIWRLCTGLLLAVGCWAQHPEPMLLAGSLNFNEAKVT